MVHFSLTELKAQVPVSFSYHLFWFIYLHVILYAWLFAVLYKFILFSTFLTNSTKPGTKYQSLISQGNLCFQVCSNDRPCLFPREKNNNIVKIHVNFKNGSRTARLISAKLHKEFLIISNKNVWAKLFWPNLTLTILQLRGPHSVLEREITFYINLLVIIIIDCFVQDCFCKEVFLRRAM